MDADARSVRTLCERALAGESLSRDDVVKLLDLKDMRSLEILRQAAEEGLRRWVGDTVDVLFRLPISSYCSHDCLYCDLRASNENLERYRLTPEQIISTVQRLQEYTYGTIVLDAAQDPSLDQGFMDDVLAEVRRRDDLTAPVLCLGERSRDFYEHLRSQGVERYILDHKTASPILYNELHPQRDFFDRLQCIRNLLELGFKVGTSLTVGLPHQDQWDLADDVFQVRELGLDTVIVGPFIPGPTSPLSASPRGTVQSSLSAIAVARLVLKDARIPGGLSLGFIDRGSMVEALRWGADCVICNVTPPRQRDERPSELATTVGPVCDSITTRIRSLGRQIGERDQTARA